MTSGTFALQWKFAFLSMGRPEYLEESDIVSNRFQVCGASFPSLLIHSPHHMCLGIPNFLVGFQKRDVYGAWEQYLGLEHTENAANQVCTRVVIMLKQHL